MSMTSHYLTCAGREIHYTDWGAQHARTVIAWHGLARTGRDMDELAAYLSERTDGYRVICPDTIGRGLSQWSPLPEQEYCLAFYARIAADLFAQLKIDKAHWVGTSMGGALGMVCASGLFQPDLKQRIQSLTLNDTAPQVADAAIARIRSYAGSPPAFATVLELEAFFRQVYKPYGALTDAQWRRLTETSTRRLPDGTSRPTMTRPWCSSSSATRTTIWCGTTTTPSPFPCCACAVKTPIWCCVTPPPKCCAEARALGA